jgi:hypothetical protein
MPLVSGTFKAILQAGMALSSWIFLGRVLLHELNFADSSYAPRYNRDGSGYRRLRFGFVGSGGTD